MRAELRLPGTIGFKCRRWGCSQFDRFVHPEETVEGVDPLRPKCPECSHHLDLENWFAWRPWHRSRPVRRWRGPDRMPVFVSFAGEDAQYRDYFVEHTEQPTCPYQVIDHSSYGTFDDDEWKRRMRVKIRRSALTVMLIGPNTHQAAGAIWEVETSLVEGIPVFGIRILPGQWVTYPRCFRPEHVIRWTWDGIAEMFDNAARHHAVQTPEWIASPRW